MPYRYVKKTKEPIAIEYYRGPWSWAGTESAKERKRIIRKGFHDFKRDMDTAKTENARTIIEHTSLDLQTVKPPGIVGIEPKDTDMDIYKSANAHALYRRIQRHAPEHEVTYLLDCKGQRYGAILWRGKHNYNDALSAATTALKDAQSVEDQIEGKRGKNVTTSHALIKGPGSGSHAVDPITGESGLHYKRAMVDNMEHWKQFFAVKEVQHIKKRCSAFLYRAFPHHGRLLRTINTTHLFNIQPCNGFFFGNQASLAINHLSPAPLLEPHRDTNDLAASLCGIYPFGQFDPTVDDSGALLLHEAKVKIILGPGDFCLFPSALITHSNVPLATGHCRGSLVSFTSHSLVNYLGMDKVLMGSKGENQARKDAWFEKAGKFWDYFVKWGELLDHDMLSPI